MSAKKCREKKKDYLNNLEEQVEKYKKIINHYENIFQKNQSLENVFNQINEKENYLFLNDIPDSKFEEIKKEYKNEQIWLQNKLLNKLIRIMIPLEYKIFYQKFLKLDIIEENDDIKIMKSKINNNISMYNIFLLI
jgi:hypothetical protein